MQTKKPVSKRTTPLIEQTPETKKEDDKSLTSNRPLHIKAVLRTDTTATFLNEDNDFFYKYLQQRHKEHQQFIEGNKPKKYNQPYSASGFKFKTAKPCVYFNKQGNVCMADDLYNKTCSFTIQVIPYEYEHQAGLTLRVLSIVLI